jgi:nonsense-mediated mRNA decay protein 3
MDKLCPRCGSLSSQKKFVGDFCLDCFSSRIKLECPRKIAVPLCASCGKMRAKDWVEMSERSLEEFVLSKCKGGYTNARLSLEPTQQVIFTFEGGDSSIELTRDVELEFQKTNCRICSRKTSGYFEAIVQIRGEKEKMEKLAERISRKLEKSTTISKTEELKEGIDYYVVSKKATGEVLSSLGLSFTTSNKLFGVKDGQRIYRTTFCVRV